MKKKLRDKMSKRKLLKKKMERKNKKLLKEKQKERLLREETKVNRQKLLMKGQLNMGKKEIFHNRMDLKKKEKDVVSAFVADLKKKKRKRSHFQILRRKNSV